MRCTRPAFVALLSALTVAAIALSGCAQSGSDSDQVTPTLGAVNPELATNPDIPVVENIQYGLADTTPLLLDACLPKRDDQPDQPAVVDPGTDQDPAVEAANDTPRPAIVVIHGGSWARGDKADIAWRAVCQWLASEGYPAFAIDYRLAPASVFPAAIDDVQAAVAWLREPEQQVRFNIDPDRIGAFGGSAGGNLAALLGTLGSGSWSVGSRVAAVVDLSGPVDLTGTDATDDFVPVQLAYLGCATEADCPNARVASPYYAIDPTDPPFFVAHSTNEKIPLGQSKRFVAKLRKNGVATTFVTVDGTLHSIAMLDADLKQRIIDFYNAHLLGSPVVADSDTDANAVG